jgi:Type IV secretion-system coupling protein DNA-binding domain
MTLPFWIAAVCIISIVVVFTFSFWESLITPTALVYIFLLFSVAFVIFFFIKQILTILAYIAYAVFALICLMALVTICKDIHNIYIYKLYRNIQNRRRQPQIDEQRRRDSEQATLRRQERRERELREAQERRERELREAQERQERELRESFSQLLKSIEHLIEKTKKITQRIYWESYEEGSQFHTTLIGVLLTLKIKNEETQNEKSLLRNDLSILLVKYSRFNFLVAKNRNLLLEQLQEEQQKSLCLPWEAIETKSLALREKALSELSGVKEDMSSIMEANKTIYNFATSFDELETEITTINASYLPERVEGLKQVESQCRKHVGILESKLSEIEKSGQSNSEVVNAIHLQISSTKKSFNERKEKHEQRGVSLCREFIHTPSFDAAGFILARNLEWFELPIRMLALGSTGSGKSMFLEMALYPLYLTIAKQASNDNASNDNSTCSLRVMLFDVDGDLLPILDGVGISSSKRYLLNPYDVRDEQYGFVGWDIAKDLNSRRAIRRFTEIIIPDEKNTENASSHFNKLIRNILQVVMIRLRDKKRDSWTLYEALFRVFNKDLLENDLKQGAIHYDGLYEAVFAREEHGQDSISTIWARLQDLLDIAALWHKRKKKISVREWLETSNVLALGWQGDSSNAISRLNQAIIQVFADIVERELPQVPYPTTTVVIDEATLLAPLPGVDKLFTYGRKKGVSVYIAFQSIPEALDKFGEGTIKAILGQCDVKALLRTNCSDTAKWMAERCGEEMKDDYLTDISFGDSEQQSTGKTITVASSSSIGKSKTISESMTDPEPYQKIIARQSGDVEKISASRGIVPDYWDSDLNLSASDSIQEQHSQADANSSVKQFGKSRNISVRQQRQRHPRVEYTEFLDLQRTTPETGVSGVIIAPDLMTERSNSYRVTLNPDIISRIRLPRSNSQGFILRNEDETEDIIKAAYNELKTEILHEQQNLSADDWL